MSNTEETTTGTEDIIATYKAYNKKPKYSINEVIVDFAILWGAKICSAFPYNAKQVAIAEEMKLYDTEELIDIFAKWSEEWSENYCEEDLGDLFERKLAELIDSNDLTAYKGE